MARPIRSAKDLPKWDCSRSVKRVGNLVFGGKKDDGCVEPVSGILASMHRVMDSFTPGNYLSVLSVGYST